MACRWLFLSSLVLVGVILFVYRDAPNNVFHFDDHDNIVAAPAIHLDELDLDGFRRVLTGAHLPSRPVPNLTLALDWWRGGGEPAAFQRTNLAIHCLVAVCVFVLFYEAILRRDPAVARDSAVVAALLAAMIWAVHPIQVQAVTYVVQRMASLAALFMLCSVLSYLYARRSEGRRKWGFLTACVVSGCFAALSKQNGFITPMLLLLAEYGLVRNRHALIAGRPDALLLSAPLIVSILAAMDIATGQGPLSWYVLPDYENRDFTLAERLLTQPRVIFFYLSQIGWPLPGRFSIEHAFTVSKGWFEPVTTTFALAGLLGWVAVGVALLCTKHARSYGGFLLWLPGTLVIESSVVPLEMVFEHRMYFPSVGLAGLLALGLYRAASRGPASRAAVTLASLGIGLLLAWSSMIRIPLWSSHLALSEDGVRHAPASARAWANLGLFQFESGESAAAQTSLGKSLALDPRYPVALETLAVLCMDAGRLLEAEALFARALKQTGTTASLLNHYGELLLKRSDYAGARRYFLDAIKRKGWKPAYYWNLAIAYERGGDCASALATWRQYLDLEHSAGERQKVDDHLREHYYSRTGRCF